MTWQDWVQLGGVVISAGAAVGAVFFAWRTVEQTRDLRREDRVARLGELVGDFAATLLRVMQGSEHERRTGLPVNYARLNSSVAAFGEPLPACRELLSISSREGVTYDQAVMQTRLASDELAQLSHH